MDTNSKNPKARQKTITIITILLVTVILSVGMLIFKPETQKDDAPWFKFQTSQNIEKNLPTIQKNTLLPTASVFQLKSQPLAAIFEQEPKIAQRIRVVVTAYSSTVCQTDDTPFITASNSRVRKGIVANNFFPFGTRVRMPEIWGNKIFTVEDRMHWRKSNYHFDIWFYSKQEAINFGIKNTYVEILKD